MEIFNYWQFYLVLGYISSVVFLQSYKFAVRKAIKNGAATVLLQLIAIFVYLLIVPLYEIKFPSEATGYILLAIASIFYAFTDRTQTTVRKNLEVSEYSLLNQLRVVVLIVIGVMFFKEALLWNKVLGAGLILFANALLVFRGGKFKMNRYVWLAIAVAFSSAIALSIDVGISELFNLPIYISITFFIPMMIICLVERIKFREIIREYRNGDGKFYVITGVAWAINSICIIRALQIGELTVVAPLLAVTVLLNVIFAAVIHKEYNNFWKKIFAAILTIVGIVLIFSFN